jgi:flagellar L-ring protein precursor FlgH
MKKPTRCLGIVVLYIMALIAGLLQAEVVCAQESSLFRQSPPAGMVNNTFNQGSGAAEVPGAPLRNQQSAEMAPNSWMGSQDVGLTGASWTYAPPPPMRNYRLQDIITIRVDELARARADGTSQVRKNTLYDAVLMDWIAFRNGDLGTDSQATGDPRINGQTNQLYRANSTLDTRETMAFNVAARIVDIQPNGNLVLEARKTIWLNDNRWETALSGICRAQDIGVDNVVLSRDLLDLQIRKNEEGQLRDGYKRGWLTRWIDEFNPF